MTDSLDDAMDAYAFLPGSGGTELLDALYRWMDEATRHIRRLERELTAVTRVLDERTEHLA